METIIDCPKCGGLARFQWVFTESNKVPSYRCIQCSYTIWVNHTPVRIVDKIDQRGKYDRKRDKE